MKLSLKSIISSTGSQPELQAPQSPGEGLEEKKKIQANQKLNHHTV